MTSGNAQPLDQLHEHLQAHLAELADARQRAVDAQQAADDIRDATHAGLRRYGVQLIVNEQSVPSALLRTRYWGHLEIHAQEIATSLGFRSTHELAEAVGPDDRRAD